MLGFGDKPQAAAAGGGLVKESTDAKFMADVIEASKEVPVIVDFWAPWCGPCKQLGPALEKAVAEQKGKVRMVKINIDEHQQVAGQLRVQSIPAVFAFVDGRPVDGFQGALPPSQIKQFIEGLLRMGGGSEAQAIEEALTAAEGALEQKSVAEAASIFAQILQVDPENLRAIAGLSKSYLASGDIERAKEILAAAPAGKANDPVILGAASAIALAEQSAGLGELGQLQAAAEANPGDLQARYDYAVALGAADKKMEAVEALLAIFKADRDWNDGAAKAQLFKFFEAWGPKDAAAQAGRRRLSSLIFA